ncbi:MAG: hypothetical protein C4K49_08290 [Candidatus Thorarchaeota archaeon]|nr:MAG: hypothetical protein C4K49_08290 [Candidatus Thorarchaeota archaeon]
MKIVEGASGRQKTTLPGSDRILYEFGRKRCSLILAKETSCAWKMCYCLSVTTNKKRGAPAEITTDVMAVV